jgi:hypothetical protein
MKKSFISLFTVIVALMIAFIALRASGPSAIPTGTCKESLNRCPVQQERNASPGSLPLDNFSRQFFSFTSFN